MALRAAINKVCCLHGRWTMFNFISMGIPCENIYDVPRLSDSKMDFLLAKEQCAVNIEIKYEIILAEAELKESKSNEEVPLDVTICPYCSKSHVAASVSTNALFIFFQSSVSLYSFEYLESQKELSHYRSFLWSSSNHLHHIFPGLCSSCSINRHHHT